jgi:5-methylcytosine-specific restriction enzyme A
MNAETSAHVTALVLRKLGLHVTAEITGGEMNIWPTGYDRKTSFFVRFSPAWRSADAILLPGKFAGETVRAMGEAFQPAKAFFVSYVTAFKSLRIQITMKVNGADVDPLNSATWPSPWTSFEVKASKAAIVFDLHKDAELLPIADLLVTPLVGMAMALIGTENIQAFEGETDGTAVQYLATRYERKKINRDACIRIHGSRCIGCNLSFGEFYGPVAEGYIEVHHIESLASSGEVTINPATDLVPLCSNCHSVVHRQCPPLNIEELQRVVSDRRDSCSNV